MQDIISFTDFQKLDIRVGTIIEIFDFPQAKKPAYKLTVDFGNLGIKKTSAQITDYYSKEVLLGTQIVAIVNFPKKQIANFFSECLVLGVYDDKHQVILLRPDQKVGNGLFVG
ncbi:MAG: tRNA-binding protein [Sediminibacterium sp.]|nr:tRNA-binding protein [Sediminibacterium sp.]